jgi:uncharacterized protein (DUF302 family)
MMNNSLVFETQLPLPYKKAINAVEDAFKQEGFGIITQIDAQATFKEKLNEDFRPFKIIGVCKPSLAHRLLKVEPKMGLLLPCKVTVEAVENGESIVRIINPRYLDILGIGDDPEIEQVAQEAEASIRRVVQRLENL